MKSILPQQEISLQLINRNISSIQVIHQISVLHPQLIDLILHTNVLIMEISFFSLQAMDKLLVLSVK